MLSRAKKVPRLDSPITSYPVCTTRSLTHGVIIRFVYQMSVVIHCVSETRCHAIAKMTARCAQYMRMSRWTTETDRRHRLTLTLNVT